MNKEQVDKLNEIRARRISRKNSGGVRNDYGVPGMKWGEHKEEEKGTHAPKGYKISNPDSKCTLDGNNGDVTDFVHGNGAWATVGEVKSAVSYMYGQSNKQSETDLKNGVLSNRDVQRALNYSQTKGLPGPMKQDFFADLNKQNIG